MCRGDHWSPANLVQQRVFQESIFTEKRARASNARPYKSFGSLIDVLWLWLTMWTATAGVVSARKRFAAS